MAAQPGLCRAGTCVTLEHRGRFQSDRSQKEGFDMKAITVTPGKPMSTELRDIPNPSLDDISGGRGVLVRVLRVGLDGTDKEIYAGEYGVAPAGSEFLVQGHESFGVVEEVGPAMTELAPGDFVVARVRRAGGSLYDHIGMPDMTTDDQYFEHGISRVHGLLTEHYVEGPEYLLRLPPGPRGCPGWWSGGGACPAGRTA